VTREPIFRGGVRSLAIGLALTLVSLAALADVVAIVSAKSAITTLTKAQMADIFLGRVSRFPNGKEAVPLDQAEDARARTEFYSKLAGRSAPQMKAYWAKIIFTGRGQPPQEVRDDAEMRKRIAENPAAVGYMDESLVDDSVRIVRLMQE
jgi:ABC-type phosphate transport system substrate-binding protein